VGLDFHERKKTTTTTTKKKQNKKTEAPLSTNPALIGIILPFLASNRNLNLPKNARLLPSRL